MLSSNILNDYIKKYNLDEIIDFYQRNEKDHTASIDPNFKKPYPPDIKDLVRLHKLCIDRKVTTILEFGCGFSTLIFAHALNINKEKHSTFVTENLRRNNPFEIHSVDNMQEFISATLNRIPKELITRVLTCIIPKLIWQHLVAVFAQNTDNFLTFAPTLFI